METTTLDHSRQWLYDRFMDAKSTNERTSLRAFARKIGIPASAASEILAGKRLLSHKMAETIAIRLKLNAVDHARLRRSVGMTKMLAKFPDENEFLRLSDQHFSMLDLDTFKLISEWYHYAILSLSEVKGCRCSPAWVAERLGISRTEARLALSTLERLQLISKQGKGFKQTGKPLNIETKGYEKAIQNFLQENSRKAQAALTTVPAEHREYGTTILAANLENLPKARVLIKQFRRDLTALLERGDKSRVYSLSVQLFPLDQVNVNEQQRIH